jgi:hypothetical protein
MADNNRYTCSCCGKAHEEWPALTYISPTNYNNLSEEDKATIGELDTDFCIIRYSDHTARFIRCTLTQKVIDHCEDLEYGLWVSLSEKSFQDYSANFLNENHLTQYFGWLSSDLPDYDFTQASIPTTVLTRSGNSRPQIIPHKEFDHPFVKDYYLGITKNDAERRINDMIQLINDRDNRVRG